MCSNKGAFARRLALCQIRFQTLYIYCTASCARSLWLLSKFRQPGVYDSNAKGPDPRRDGPRSRAPTRRSQGTSREERRPTTNTRAYLHEGWGGQRQNQLRAYDCYFRPGFLGVRRCLLVRCWGTRAASGPAVKHCCDACYGAPAFAQEVDDAQSVRINIVRKQESLVLAYADARSPGADATVASLQARRCIPLCLSTRCGRWGGGWARYGRVAGGVKWKGVHWTCCYRLRFRPA